MKQHEASGNGKRVWQGFLGGMRVSFGPPKLYFDLIYTTEKGLCSRRGETKYTIDIGEASYERFTEFVDKIIVNDSIQTIEIKFVQRNYSVTELMLFVEVGDLDVLVNGESITKIEQITLPSYIFSQVHYIHSICPNERKSAPFMNQIHYNGGLW